METTLQGYILAIITTDPSMVTGSGCPVFYAADPAEQQRLSLLLSRVLGGSVHDLENGVLFISKH